MTIDTTGVTLRQGRQTKGANFAGSGAAILSAIALLLSPAPVVAQEVIIDMGAGGSSSTPTNVCETGDTKAASWMSRAPVLSEIKRNVDLFVVGTSSSVDPSFYYSEKSAAGLAKGQENWRKAQTSIASVKEILEKLASVSFTDWQPACEACNRFRSWWNLFDVARKQAADMASRKTADGAKTQGPDTIVKWKLEQTVLGGIATFSRTAEQSVNVKGLTDEQVEYRGETDSSGNPTYYGVTQLVTWYNALASQKPTADPADPDAKACLANMLPRDLKVVPTVKQCKVDHFEQGIDILVGRLVQSLIHAGKSKASNRMTTLLKDSKGLFNSSCPRNSYPNNWRLTEFE